MGLKYGFIYFWNSNEVFIVVIIYKNFLLVINLEEIDILILNDSNELGDCIEREIYFHRGFCLFMVYLLSWFVIGIGRK
jgi:hypothetical protein